MNKGIVKIKRIIWNTRRYRLPKLFNYLYKMLFHWIPLRDTMIFESHNDFDMNAGTFFWYLIENGYQRKYKMIWFTKQKKEPIKLNNVVQFPFYSLSPVKAFYNATAKYIFYDNYIISRFRDEQIVIYTTHATRVVKNCKGMIRLPDDIDYVVSASHYNDALMSEVYMCDKEKMIETGMPVTDLFYKPGGDLCKLLNGGGWGKTIVWMPTFRRVKGNGARNDSALISETGLSLITSADLYKGLDAFLKENGVKLIIKFHPLQEMKDIKIKDTNNIMLLSAEDTKRRGVDIYRLLKEVDALITDYSSISFDFLLLDKPIAYVLEDMDSYLLGLAERNMDAYLPGDKIYTIGDMKKFLTKVVNNEDDHQEERNELKRKVHKFDDGRSCERLASYLGI